MPVDTKVSLCLSSALAVTTLAASQVFKAQLSDGKGMTILAGGLCSLLFMFLLTALGNLEGVLMGKGFEVRIFPEGMSIRIQSWFWQWYYFDIFQKMIVHDTLPVFSYFLFGGGYGCCRDRSSSLHNLLVSPYLVMAHV